MFHKRQFWGFVFLVAGAFILLVQAEVISHRFQRTVHTYWPILLILLGLYLLTKYFSRRHGRDDFTISIDGSTAIHGFKKHSRTFGDIRIDADNIEIDGLSSTVTFGDTFMNLTKGKIKPGINTVDISSIFGDITILLPSNIEAAASVSTTFGDIQALGKSSEGIGNRLESKTAGFDAAANKIQVFAHGTFGDIRVIRS